MCTETTESPPLEALFRRCRQLLHECLDAAKVKPGTDDRARLVNQLHQLICVDQAHLKVTTYDWPFDRARAVTYQLLESEGLDCSADADFAFWRGQQRWLVAA